MHSIIQYLLPLVIFCTAVSAGSCKAQGQGVGVNDVLRNVELALQPPLRCRMRVASLESLVSKKQLVDGTIATRAEAVDPSQAIVISHDDANFEVLPLSRIVIDKTQIKIDEYLKGRLRGNENAVCFIPQVPPGYRIVSRDMAEVVHDGRPCFQITTSFSAAVLDTAVTLNAKLGDAFPASHILIVDRQEMKPIELRSLSSSGRELSTHEYLEISHPADMPDDVFALPGDYEVQTPQDLDEYYEIHKTAWDLLYPDRRRFWPRVYSSPNAFRSLTGREPIDVGAFEIGNTTVAQFEDAAATIPNVETEPQVPSKKRSILLYINVGVIVLVALIIIFTSRKPRSRVVD